MKQKIQISIPKPCHEGWQNMTAVEKGRFCSSCQKTVLDFTYLSDNEIINLISKNNNLCGRINVSQLNRNLIETKIKSNYFGYLATSVLVFLGLGTENVVAQEKPVTEQIDKKILNEVTDSVKKITVTGIVTDDSGKFLPAVNITIKNTQYGVQTNMDGSYNISCNLNDELFFFYDSFLSKSIIVKSNIMNITLVRDEKYEEVLVTIGFVKKRTFFGRIFYKIGNWFR